MVEIYVYAVTVERQDLEMDKDQPVWYGLVVSAKPVISAGDMGFIDTDKFKYLVGKLTKVGVVPNLSYLGVYKGQQLTFHDAAVINLTGDWTW